ncbi:MAG: hypothetical protein DWI24_01210 [Planctomycetota bacterium]|nr:MAG: hypothetical protein DWI24_01210 [Planctomycetota bacterium]
MQAVRTNPKSFRRVFITARFLSHNLIGWVDRPASSCRTLNFSLIVTKSHDFHAVKQEHRRACRYIVINRYNRASWALDPRNRNFLLGESSRILVSVL